MNEFVQIDIDEYRRLIELNESRRNQIDDMSVTFAKCHSKCEKLLKKYVSDIGFTFLIEKGVAIEELTDIESRNYFLSPANVMKLMVMGFTPSEIDTAIRLAVEEAKRGTEQQ